MLFDRVHSLSIKARFAGLHKPSLKGNVILEDYPEILTCHYLARILLSFKLGLHGEASRDFKKSKRRSFSIQEGGCIDRYYLTSAICDSAASVVIQQYFRMAAIITSLWSSYTNITVKSIGGRIVWRLTYF